MRVIIDADDGDEIVVVSDELSSEQSIVRMERHHPHHDEVEEFDWVILSPARARQLAFALYHASELIERLPSGDLGSSGLQVSSTRASKLGERSESVSQNYFMKW